MKKYIILLIVGIFAFANSSADIYTSVSKKIEIKKEKKVSTPIKLNWYGKAGINIGVTKGELSPLLDETPTTFGLDLNPGFYCFFRPSKPSDFYWGADINVGVNFIHLNEGSYEVSWSSNSSYYYWSAQNFFLPYVNIAPQLGWRKKLSNSLDLDIHIEPVGLYISTTPEYDYHHDANSRYESIYGNCPCDVYSKIGLGLWHKNMIYDISYRKPWVDYPGTITLGVGIQF